MIKNDDGGAKSKNQSQPNNGCSSNTVVMDPQLVAPLHVATVAILIKEKQITNTVLQGYTVGPYQKKLSHPVKLCVGEKEEGNLPPQGNATQGLNLTAASLNPAPLQAPPNKTEFIKVQAVVKRLIVGGTIILILF